MKQYIAAAPLLLAVLIFPWLLDRSCAAAFRELAARVSLRGGR